MTTIRTQSPNLRWIALLAIAAAILLAVELVAPGGKVPVDTPRIVLAGLAQDYDDELARIDVAVENARRRAADHPDQWLMHEVLARALLARGRISGSYDDFAASQASLDRAFTLAPAGAGPHLSQAQLDFTMHRLPAAERQLKIVQGYGIPASSDDQAEMAAMRGDIAFYRGDYAGAMRLYDEADRLAPGTASFRRAIYASRTGDVAAADSIFAESEHGARLPTRLLLANYQLQRGILDLDTGRWDEALAHFREGDRLFPGYWLIQEHIAEVTALKGDGQRAEALYRDIVRRTGHPEFMDALAGLLDARGDAAGAAQLRRQATAVWRKRLGQFPEASYGHAFDHCVDAGDWNCALRLAERNHRARPYGEAKTLLAEALLHNGRAEEARTMIDSVLASPWRTADTHAVAAQIHAAQGERFAAWMQRRKARALNAHVLDDAAGPPPGT